MRSLSLPLAIASAAALAACSNAPSHIVRSSPRSDGDLSLPLHGTYLATVTAPYIGPVSARLTAEPADNGFVAYSRPGVAWDMIGGIEGFFGPIFAPFLFPDGVILTWYSSIPTDDHPGEGTIGVGGIRAAHIGTRMRSPDAPIDLLAPDGHKVALITLRSASPDDPPLADYPTLGDHVDSTLRARLFDPDLVDSSQVRGYLEQVHSNARIARDDVEFIFGAAVAAKQHIRFSFPLVIRRANEATRAAFPQVDPDLATVRATFDKDTRIATFRADAFLDAADVDRTFKQILAWHPRGVIIDVNACPGVTLASLRIASWVFDHPIDAGFFFGPTRREEGLEGHMDGFPRIHLDSAGAITNIESALDREDAACVIAIPEKEAFTGPVAVLASKRTTTSAEPLVALLKSTGRARVFGQATAGKPMVSRPIDIGQGWDLWLASADYRPALGDRINDKGVRPDEEFSSKEAAKRAAKKWILEQAPEAKQGDSAPEP